MESKIKTTSFQSSSPSVSSCKTISPPVSISSIDLPATTHHESTYNITDTHQAPICHTTTITPLETITTKSLSVSESPPTTTPFDDYCCSLMFVLSGMLSFFVFYQMSLSFVALDFVWPGHLFSDVLGGSEYITATFVSLFMIPYNEVRTDFFYISSAISFVASLAFPLVVTFLPGNENFKLARLLLVCVTLITGVGDSLLTMAGYSIAAIMPRNRVGLRVAGSALSGTVPFFLFLFLSSVVFDKTEKGQQMLMWTFMPLGSIFSLILIFCVIHLSRRQWFRDCLRNARELHEGQYSDEGNRWKAFCLCKSNKHPLQDDDLDQRSPKSTDNDNNDDDDNETDNGPRDFITVIKSSGIHAISSSLLVITAWLLSPFVLPYAFHLTYTWTTVINGTGNIAHTFGRFLAIYVRSIRIRPHWLFPIVLIRCSFFLPFFIIIARFPTAPFLTNPWFLCFCTIVFFFTHGWTFVLTQEYCIKSVSHPQERAIASKIVVLTGLLSSTIGQFAAKLTTL